MTERQKEIYEFIILFMQENGYPPSYKEIGEALHIADTGIGYHLRRLEEQGYIEIKRKIPRAIKVKGYKFVKEE